VSWQLELNINAEGQHPPEKFCVRVGQKVLEVCVTVHHQYNDVSNQKDATNFSFINLFNSALRVSGDKFAHPQELFLTVETAFVTMHRHCCRPVPRCTCRQQCRCIVAKLHIQSKRAPEDGRICRLKHVGLS